MTDALRPSPMGLEAILAEFTSASNRHDLDAVMSFFADDCIYLASTGHAKYGTVYRGRDAVRAALADGLLDCPDGRYEEVSSFIHGEHAALKWPFIGASITTGERIVVRGCDLIQFAHGKIIVKDAFRKERHSP